MSRFVNAATLISGMFVNKLLNLYQNSAGKSFGSMHFLLPTPCARYISHWICNVPINNSSLSISSLSFKQLAEL